MYSSPPPPPPLYSSISEPNKIEKFHFQTSRILLLTNVQKLHEPEISQFLQCMLQFLDNLWRLSIFSSYKGKIDHFLLDLLKRSDTYSGTFGKLLIVDHPKEDHSEREFKH